MFTHKHPKFDGINDLYADKILPQLLPFEQERQKFQRSFKISAVLIAGFAMAAAIYLYLRFEHLAAPFLSLFCGAAAIRGYYEIRSATVRHETKSILMNAISSHLGLLFTLEPEMEAGFLPKLQELSLIPQKIDRVHFEDHISGELGDVALSIYESKLERKVKTNKGHRWQTVFKGSILRMDFHREFMGTTIVLRDAGVFNSKRKGMMKRIGLASPKFEKIFEAYGTDQVEGRYLLTPTFMETLMELEDSVDGKKTRFAFHDESLWIAVEHPNRFETKSLKEPITDSARVQTVIDELESVLSIVSAVSKPERKRYS